MSLEDINGSSYADSQDLQEPVSNTENDKILTDNSNIQNDDLVQNNSQKDFEERDKSVDDVKDKNFYEEILAKLDIKPKNQEEKFNDKDNTKLNSEDIKVKDVAQSLEKSMSKDLAIIQKLVKNGVINSNQGQNLKKQVLTQAFNKIVQTEKIKRNFASVLKTSDNSQVKQDLIKNNLNENSNNIQNFFETDGRKEVLNYLKTGGVSLGKDELGKISDIVRVVEKSAIDRFLQKAAHEKSIQTSNENAKKKLRANAQSQSVGGNVLKSFTREQIGKMSGTEFAKYESAIMEALKKGQIK